MTKQLRIENADNSEYKVKVEVFEKNTDGRPDTSVVSYDLDYPTIMCEPLLTSTRYIVITEK